MHRGFWSITLGSIGVVYGDIGTSPLYAVRESVLAARGASEVASAEIILGILSLIIWALILVVTVKYVLLLLRADNDGEGGTLALMALAQRAVGGRSLLVLSLGIIGAALFYGDAMLTPAVSVLSAVEGLEIRRSRPSVLCRAANGAYSRRLVRGAVARHSQRCRSLPFEGQLPESCTAH